jgi:hypothetical protein
MKGDFSRNSFDPLKHFSRVLMQQGRVQLDSDFNEQASILLHYLRTLASDLIGPHGGPMTDLGFRIITSPDKQLTKSERDRLESLRLLPLQEGDFLIGGGRYYVDGLMCENDYFALYSDQPDLRPDRLDKSVRSCLVYLDVYERHVSAAEDDSIREVALEGPDTTSRAKLVWQIRTQVLEGGTTCANMKPSWDSLMKLWAPDNRGLLRARAKQTGEDDYSEPCIISPESRYRGAENQLYRVEVHYGSDKAKGPTFKWSRDNGSVVFPVVKLNSDGSATTVTVEDLGRDNRSGLKPGDWVEVQHDDQVFSNTAQPLLRVGAVDPIDRRVTLEGVVSSADKKGLKNALLRRWDQTSSAAKHGGEELVDGAMPVPKGQGVWLTLEDGIQIQFEAGATYRTGDYWLIPARTATGDVVWPSEGDKPKALPPRGVRHHYAPLGIIGAAAPGGAGLSLISDCRCAFGPRCYGYGYYGYDDYRGVGAENILAGPRMDRPFNDSKD